MFTLEIDVKDEDLSAVLREIKKLGYKGRITVQDEPDDEISSVDSNYGKWASQKTARLRQEAAIADVFRLLKLGVSETVETIGGILSEFTTYKPSYAYHLMQIGVNEGWLKLEGHGPNRAYTLTQSGADWAAAQSV